MQRVDATCWSWNSEVTQCGFFYSFLNKKSLKNSQSMTMSRSSDTVEWADVFHEWIHVGFDRPASTHLGLRHNLLAVASASSWSQLSFWAQFSRSCRHLSSSKQETSTSLAANCSFLFSSSLMWVFCVFASSCGQQPTPCEPRVSRKRAKLQLENENTRHIHSSRWVEPVETYGRLW